MCILKIPYVLNNLRVHPFYPILPILIIGLISHQAIPQTVVTTIELERDGRQPAAYPSGVGINPSTNLIYVAHAGIFDDTDNSKVSVIDGVTNQVIDTIEVGVGPEEIGVNALTNLIYVANTRSNTVSVIDGVTNQVIDTIEMGVGPIGVGANPLTNHIFVSNIDSDHPTNNSTVSVIDGHTNQVINTIPVGIDPRKIGVNPSTNLVYVSNFGSCNVTVILDEIITEATPTPISTPTPTTRKRFTFDCDHDIVKGHSGLEILTIRKGEEAHCILRLRDVQPDIPIEVLTMVRKGLRSSVKIEPIRGVADPNGELNLLLSL